MAHRESETAEERRHYADTQSVRLQEIDAHGIQAGEYREVRDVIFSPTGEVTERFPTEPVSHLKNLIMTPEDFADLRDIQPFVMTGRPAFHLRDSVQGRGRNRRPRLLGSSRSGRGRYRPASGCSMACSGSTRAISRSSAAKEKAVPQIITTKTENLFPRFATVRKQGNGFWFPASYIGR